MNSNQPGPYSDVEQPCTSNARHEREWICKAEISSNKAAVIYDNMKCNISGLIDNREWARFSLSRPACTRSFNVRRHASGCFKKHRGLKQNHLGLKVIGCICIGRARR